MSDPFGPDGVRLTPDQARAKLAETEDVAEFLKRRGPEGLARCEDPPPGLDDPASLVLARRQRAVHPALKEAFLAEAARLSEHAQEMVASVGKYTGQDAESAEDTERTTRGLEEG